MAFMQYNMHRFRAFPAAYGSLDMHKNGEYVNNSEAVL